MGFRDVQVVLSQSLSGSAVKSSDTFDKQFCFLSVNSPSEQMTDFRFSYVALATNQEPQLPLFGCSQSLTG